MNDRKDFLIEIGTEEMPAKMLLALAKAFAANLTAELTKNELSYDQVQFFTTPRRLAVLIKNIPIKQASRFVERKGPAVATAFDKEGKPTQAVMGFANSCGVSVEQLNVKKTDKGDWLFFSQQQEGESTSKLVPQLINNALMKLPIPKPMRWGNNTTQFIRPVHWVLLLFGNEIIKTTLLNCETDGISFGHRFHYPQKIVINTPDEYEQKLYEQGKVIADYEKRKHKIREQVQKIAAEKGIAAIDEELLDEITGLVEWPVALLGEFDKEFLTVPAEALITAMKNHQKYFAVFDKNKHILPYFIAVSNIESKQVARVIAGNQRVLRARLSDAQFFYHADKQHTLEYYLEQLKTVVFQQKLGTLYDKAQRIAKLAKFISETLNTDVQQAERAGLLAKTDLMTTMVNEFPELQGIMGYYYAKNNNESESIAVALREHYQPRFAGDAIPKTTLGSIIAIADKIDTLVGIFGIEQLPTGEKDPFGLRRAALGILRIIIENKLSLDVKELLKQAAINYASQLTNSDLIAQTLNFMMERLRAWYLERGVAADVFNAVLARYPTQPLDFDYRIKAVQKFQKLPQAIALTVANKRVSNILKKQGEAIVYQPVNPSLLVHEAEKQLAHLMEQKHLQVERFYQHTRYEEALTTLAELQSPIDRFFDNVLVMDDNINVRDNRLALLNNLRNLFLFVADISLLQ